MSNDDNVLNFTQSEDKSNKKKPRGPGRPRKSKDLETDDELVLPEDKPERLATLQRRLLKQLNYDTADKSGARPLPSEWVAMYTDDLGEPYPIKIDYERRTAKRCTWKAARRVIADLAEAFTKCKKVPYHYEYKWGSQRIKTCYELWTDIGKSIPKPKAWGFINDPEICFLRHPFEPDPEMESPAWEALLSRFKDRETFELWVGSFFFERSSRNQYFYLQGEGGDGKGAIGRFFAALFGEGYFGTQEMPGDKFYGTYFDGYIMTCFSDLKDIKFLRSQALLGVTGGDIMGVERKGVDIKAKKVSARILILSNLEPVISQGNHDLRRILWSSLSPLPKDTPILGDEEYDDMLYYGAPGFLGRCIEKYRKRYDLGPLTQPDEIKQIIKTFCDDPLSSEFEDFADDHFVFYGPPADGKKMSLNRHAVSVATVNALVARRWPRGDDRAAFTKWLLTVKHCAKGSRVPRPGRHWYGMGLRNGRLCDDGVWEF